MWFSKLLLLVILTGCTWSASYRNVRYNKINNMYQSWEYLNKYGYNPCSNSSKKVACSLDHSSMLRAYQKRYDLKITGVLDGSTINQMNQPRCGNKDFQAARLAGEKWPRSSLTWSLRSYPQQISKEQATAIIEKAFNTWLAHIPLQITETCSTCSADLVIDFGRYNHNCDGGSFDGPGGTLAHAFFPPHGNIHFDTDEPWTETFGNSDIHLYSVAVHEIGHALGLEHNYDRKSIMFPSYNPSLDVTVLPDYDRRSIQAMYGASSGGEDKPRKPDTSEPRKPNTSHCLKSSNYILEGGARINWRENNWALGCDFIGNDLSHVRIRAAQCGPRCDATEKCTHFTWTKENGGTCWMKTGVISKSDAVASHDRSRVCGVASGDEEHNDGIDWNGNNWAHGCDFNGNDLSHVQVPAEECGPTCDDTEGCTHFAWTKQDGGTCWMKTGPVSQDNAVAKRDQSRVCGIAK